MYTSTETPAIYKRTHGYLLGTNLSSRVMSTPTDGGAVNVSEINGQNRFRISFNDIQPVWT